LVKALSNTALKDNLTCNQSHILKYLGITNYYFKGKMH
jgi:hypothetical protein